MSDLLDQVLATFEGDAPSMSQEQFAALIGARKQQGRPLSDSEARAVLSAVQANGGNNGHH